MFILVGQCFILLLIDDASVFNSDGDPFISRKRILIHFSRGLDYILIFINHFLSTLKISKHFVFFIRTSGENLIRYGKDQFI